MSDEAVLPPSTVLFKFYCFFVELRALEFSPAPLDARPLTLLLLRASKVLVSMFMKAAAFLSLAAISAAAVVVRLNVLEI